MKTKNQFIKERERERERERETQAERERKRVVESCVFVIKF